MTSPALSGYWNRFFPRGATARPASPPPLEAPVRMTREDAMLCAFAGAADVHALCGMGAGMSAYYILLAETIVDGQDAGRTRTD